MNCTDTSDRIAAYLDGQLCPAESEQVGAHLHSCTPCHQLCDALMAQDFAPMSQEEKDAGCGATGFWNAMDGCLEAELEGLTPARPEGAGWGRRKVGLPMSVALAYAAALLLAVAWGYQHMERAEELEATARDLQLQLDQERRLAAEPGLETEVPIYRAASYNSTRPVSYTPRRSTF